MGLLGACLDEIVFTLMVSEKEKETMSNQIACNGITIHIFTQFLSFKHTLLIGTTIR